MPAQGELEIVKSRHWFLVAVLLLAGAAVVGARVLRLAVPPAAIWTPAPVTAQPSRVSNAAILPALTPSTPARPVVPSVVRATATRPLASPATSIAPGRQPTPTPIPTATQDPHRVVITEADVLRAVALGAGTEGGLVLESPGVRFTDGRMQLTATRLQYGPVDVRDLALAGRLVAQNGRLQLEVESISPRGLVTSLIPSFVNQALAQYTAQWYIEELRTLEGRLELRIR